MDINDLQTPALLVERALLQANLDAMSAALPGPRLRPHIKAHKTTELARAQDANGHHNFTCATIREMEGMAKAGLGTDLLLANEVLDTRRLSVLADDGARVTVAVDSPETVAAAADGGVIEVVVDVGLNTLGMDHGNPTIPGAAVWFCSDEHTTFAPEEGHPVKVGDRVRVLPAHIDPTVALHEAMYVVEGEEILERWAVDLRGW